MKVRDCMMLNPITVRTDTRLGDALNVMAGHQLRHLPVVDEERRFVGIIRQDDVRAAMSDDASVAEQRGVLALAVLGAPTLSGAESAEAAWAWMSRSPGVAPVPVVSGGRLEGTISLHDLLRAMAGLPRVTNGEAERMQRGSRGRVSPLAPLVPSLAPPGAEPVARNAANREVRAADGSADAEPQRRRAR